MVIASLKASARYECLPHFFHKIFEYIKTHDLYKISIGKIESEQTFILISEITAKDTKAARTATHHHLDMQIPLLATEAYNADNDVAFGVEKPTMYFELKHGDFAIFFPHAKHATGIGKGAIKKLS